MSRKNWTSDKIFSRLRNNKSKRTYWDNIGELRKRPTKKVHAAAVELCRSPIDKEKIIGIDVLAQLGIRPRFMQEETVDLYFQLLENAPSPKVLESILSGIGHNNDNLSDKHMATLFGYLDHSYSDVRFSLVHAILGVENPTAIHMLIKLSADKHPSVRDWATFGLGKQIEVSNDPIVNALWDRREDPFNQVRMEAISGLLAHKDSRIKAFLMEKLADIDDLDLHILQAIESLDDPEFINLLEKQIEANRTNKTVDEKWLQDCLDTLKENTHPER
ncbi:MAG: hypothetical protein AAF587_31385 [Bacteroidota bacterium]